MIERERGYKLRCRDGHFEMVPFEIATRPEGCWMWVSCEVDGHRGGHWLAPDPGTPGAVVVRSEPYAWPSAHDAFAARERWEAQVGD